MKCLNHVQIKVSDLGESKAFYAKVMNALGYQVVLEIKNIVVGYGTHAHDMFEICQAGDEAALSQSVHLAFNAPSRQAVNDFHRIAIAMGGECHGAPGLRPEYEEGYYAAFVVDLDGHNIEAVYKDA